MHKENGGLADSEIVVPPTHTRAIFAVLTLCGLPLLRVLEDVEEVFGVLLIEMSHQRLVPRGVSLLQGCKHSARQSEKPNKLSWGLVIAMVVFCGFFKE